MSRYAVLAVMLVASVASADERDPLDAHAPGTPTGYLSGGASVDATQGFTSSGILLEAGARLGDTPWFAHAVGIAGTIHRGDEAGRGTFGEGRIGLEGRSCAYAGMMCAGAGVDVGVIRADFHHLTYTAGEARWDESLNGFVAVPRAIFDGGGRVRFRFVVELPLYMRTSDDGEMPLSARAIGSSPTPTAATDRQFAIGIAAQGGLAVGF